MSYNKSTHKRRKRSSEPNKSSGYSSWLETCAKSKDKYLPPSAKTVALKAKILNWINEAPNDKIISQYSFLRGSTADLFHSLYSMASNGQNCGHDL